MPPQSIDDVRQWRDDLATVGELRFVELAALLRDRPQPSKAAIDADTEAAKERTGSPADRAPVWARALLDSLIAGQRLISHLQASMAADFAALAAGYPGLREHLATEIALALGCSEGSADRQLDAAEELVRRLPATQVAHYRGRLTAWKVTAIRSETNDVSDEVATQVEADVLPDAPRQTVPELRQAIRRAILLRDPEGAELRHRSAVRRRRVRTWGLPDGMAALKVTSSAPDISAIKECLSALARNAKTPGDSRVSDEREVDALVDLCTDILDSGVYHGRDLPLAQRNRPHVRITMPLDALLGSDSPCELTGYGPITADQARKIAGDGELRRMVCDPLSGTLLDYGRTTYRPPKALADHVIARDVVCSHPGCRRPAEHCELDHTVPYPEGPTSDENLAAACKHHHRAKDGGGHTTERFGDGTRCWTTPLGITVFTPAPRLWHPPRPTVPEPPAAESPAPEPPSAGSPGAASPPAQAPLTESPPNLDDGSPPF
ncbi:HNH endonuclease signature motif containing protein [Nakamurella lactea]|uniref:HNH endonuclease signature motif containing protein n=1 Tax=Nakamurella lactea TaxID=459515 RepID=UPI001376A697|nr:HNH endonuclease signature motif containing protein [Nakamurella lactea]